MILLAAALLFSDGPVMPPRVDATIEPRVAQVGDPLLLLVTIEHAQVDEVKLPSEIDFGGLDVLDQKHTAAQKGPVVTEELHIKLASYEAGDHTIAPIPIVVAGTPFSTTPLTVTTESVCFLSKPRRPLANKRLVSRRKRVKRRRAAAIGR